MDKLECISPIDGRYNRKTEMLKECFSEKALISYRIRVECEYLIALSKLQKVRELTEEEIAKLRHLKDLSLEDAQIVKDIEVKGFNNIKATNHDVKAVEYFIKYKLEETSMKDLLEFVHFGLTSEDINNLAYSLMIRDALEKVIFPVLEDTYQKIEKFSFENIPMLARTHGQSASPTTIGKEFKVFSSRLRRQMQQLRSFRILAKINGATGNYNAHCAAFPEVDWIGFSKYFIGSFNKDNKIKLETNLITTQIEPHDSYAELFDIFRRINTILIDMSQDIWRYISDSWLKQKPIEGEIGSSTMPHKVNPIDFESCEGNLGVANSLFNHFSNKLPISRLQRDLSDSTVLRNIGAAFAYSLIAYNSLIRGLSKIAVNEEEIIKELNNHPEVIAEAIQTVLRREGFKMPYEKLMELTKGRKVTLADLMAFVMQLDIPENIKQELLRITPSNYIGMAKKISDLE